MTSHIKIELEHITRVEGHGNIILDADNGKVISVQWQVPEAPRFFEAMVVGQDYHQIAHITSRICGICSIAHTLTSLKATENAMGVKISEQTSLLRKLAVHAENIQSHILHLGYLVSPDLLGVGSVFPLIKTHTDIVTKVVKIHRLGNEMSELICGRTVHPVTLTVGGFTKIPTEKKLIELKEKILGIIKTANDITDVVLANAVKLPAFTRETEYIALVSNDEYALYDGVIGSTDTGKHKIQDYLSITNEYIVPHSTAKYTKHNRDSYFVGALARYNLSSQKLTPMAKEIANKSGLKTICFNPFMNNIAQLVELYHSLEDSISLIDKLIKNKLTEEKVKIKVKAGQGVGIVEAPRGILIHDYTIDKNGKCVKANCIIPTNQNHANIQKDMELFAPTLLAKSKKEIELNLEMLVRAYDPCISCSTHYLKVKFA
ncbi:MAG: Ni/Fe hydrogenase subunit alpha [Planctomycetota bacterium]